MDAISVFLFKHGQFPIGFAELGGLVAAELFEEFDFDGRMRLAERVKIFAGE